MVWQIYHVEPNTALRIMLYLFLRIFFFTYGLFTVAESRAVCFDLDEKIIFLDFNALESLVLLLTRLINRSTSPKLPHCIMKGHKTVSHKRVIVSKKHVYVRIICTTLKIVNTLSNDGYTHHA